MRTTKQRTKPVFKIRPRQHKGRRSAERRNPTIGRAASTSVAADRCPGAAARHNGGAPAFRRFTAALARPNAYQPMAQPQNRVSRHLELAGVLPAYILASVKRAPRRPVLVPVDRCPRAARERIAFIRARAPHSLRLTESALAKGALGERDCRYVTTMGTVVKRLVTSETCKP